MSYTREPVKIDIEREIITGLIVNDHFCTGAMRMLKPEHFAAKYYRRLAGWIMPYVRKYRKAPGQEIRQIFAAEAEKLKEEETELIADVLQDISDRYVGADAQHISSEYLLDKTVAFCNMRNLEKLRDQIDGHLLKGEVEKANAVVVSYSKVRKETSRWVDPFKPSVIRQTMSSDQEDELFKLPGALGLLSGIFRRGWLISFMGSMKRGKSWYLMELAYRAIICGLKVVYISLEMSQKEALQRIYARISATGKTKLETVVFPVFDCLYNQDNSCHKEQREGDVGLQQIERDERGIPKFTWQHNHNYKTCTYCREKHLPDYEPNVWYAMQQSEQMTDEKIIKKAAQFKRMYKNNLRVIDFPPYSAGMNDIMDAVDDLEFTEGFVADIICIDYFDIAATDSEEREFSERGQIDARWKKGKRMAKERHCLIATVEQTNRGGLNRDNLELEDNSEDIRKLAHKDLQFGLNQTPDEQYAGIMRINIMVHRHERFNIKGQAMVLQSLDLGQPFLDAEFDSKTYHRMYGGKKREPQPQQQGGGAQGRRRRQAADG